MARLDRLWGCGDLAAVFAGGALGVDTAASGGRRVILAGHHRSLAALVEGRPVLARLVGSDLTPDPAAAVTATLFVGPTSRLADEQVDDVETAVGCIRAGRRVHNGGAELVAEVLRRLGLTDTKVADRLAGPEFHASAARSVTSSCIPPTTSSPATPSPPAPSPGIGPRPRVGGA